jgi:predicted RNA-binding Zn-ribbon protein involved in translation (DUF1610 family)
MRGLKAKDLSGIVDFIYNGKANIYQEDLDAFLALAEELQLKGLAGSHNKRIVKLEDPMQSSLALKKSKERQPRLYEEKPGIETKVEIESWENSLIVPVVQTVEFIEGNSNDLQSHINSMIEKIGPGEFKCTVCGKTNTHRATMRRHIETHIEGVSHPCPLCGKINRSSNSLNVHISKNHRE